MKFHLVGRLGAWPNRPDGRHSYELWAFLPSSDERHRFHCLPLNVHLTDNHNSVLGGDYSVGWETASCTFLMVSTLKPGKEPFLLTCKITCRLGFPWSKHKCVDAMTSRRMTRTKQEHTAQWTLLHWGSMPTTTFQYSNEYSGSAKWLCSSSSSLRSLHGRWIQRDLLWVKVRCLFAIWRQTLKDTTRLHKWTA